MIEEKDQIIFCVIVIKIFDHFPDHTHLYTIPINIAKS